MHAQRDVSEADDKLTAAARTVFATSTPSFWYLVAMLLPKPLVPLVRWLSARFSDEPLSALHKAYEVVYHASAFLIEVSSCSVEILQSPRLLAEKCKQSAAVHELTIVVSKLSFCGDLCL